MNQMLLVEDSTMFGRLLKAKMEKVFDRPVYWCKTFAEADELLTKVGGNFSLALLDVNLPDAPNGEIIDRVISEGISSLVFTASMSDEVRQMVWSKRVVDYILKEDPNAMDYIVSSIRQLEENENTLILVVDDSISQRTALSELLYVHKFRVLNAKDGPSALAILDQYPEIKLVVTDYNMPGMDGCTLCQRIRENHKHDTLAIIGLSSEEDRTLGAKFVKSGANDFIVKQTFLVEEFYSRVRHCLDILSLIEKNREAAIKDFLTGMYNRRYFFDRGEGMLQACRRQKANLFCAMIDIDFFKNINDKYGHEVGDEVLKQFAGLLGSYLESTDLVARIGGEEFCVLSAGLTAKEYKKKIVALHDNISRNFMYRSDDSGDVRITISIGWAQLKGTSLDELVRAADVRLYDAKNGGRNQVAG